MQVVQESDLEDECLSPLPNLTQLSLGLQHFCSSSVLDDLIHSYERSAAMLLTGARLSPVSHLPVHTLTTIRFRCELCRETLS